MKLNYYGTFVGKPRISKFLWKKKEKHPAVIMLNKAYVNSFCLLPYMKWKCRQKILTRISFLSSPSGPSAATLTKCPVISLVHWLTVEILLTIISPCSLRKQGIFRNSAKIEAPGVLNKVYDEDALPRGPTPYPFIYHFMTEKVPLRIPSVGNGTRLTCLV